MDKKSIILVIITIFIHFPALAEFYIGSKLGVDFLNNSCDVQSQCDDIDLAVGMHLGYKFNKHIDVEYGQDYLGYSSSRLNNVQSKPMNDDIWALTLAPKFNMPIANSFDVFTKIGAAYLMKGEEKHLIPTISFGSEYQINDNWSFRTEYQRYQDLTNKPNHTLDSDFFSIGFSYHFNSESEVENTSMSIQLEPLKAKPINQVVKKVHPTHKYTLHFELESAQITNTTFLRNVITIMKTYPQALIKVTGHTDSTGSEYYNKKLSTKRAQAVTSYLREHNISSKRMTAVGMGEADPIKSNSTLKGREANRRVEIKILPFMYTVTESLTNR